eukprot:4517185-Pleurochrysis_carterae.AAC.1
MHSQLRFESPIRRGSATKTFTTSKLPWMIKPVTCSFIALARWVSMHFGGREKLRIKESSTASRFLLYH